MAQSIRLLYRKVKGRMRFNWNWAPITERSAVIITAAEWSHGDGGPDPDSIVFNPLAGRTWLGDSNVYVTNVGVHGPEPDVGGVEFHLHANHDFPIDVVVTISVLDEIPDERWIKARPGR